MNILQRTSRIKVAAAVASSIVVAMLLGGAVHASIPDGEGVIHGCYTNFGGVLRVIDTSTSTCTSYEKAISWNRTGPQGPMGPTGAQGATGPAGPPGQVGANNALFTAATNQQYTLPYSPSPTWQDMDASHLKLSVNPSTNSAAVVNGSTTVVPDSQYDRIDMGISVDGQIATWQQVSGRQSVVSIETVVQLAAGQHIITLQWKPDSSTNGGATAGVMSQSGDGISPTRLTALIINQ